MIRKQTFIIDSANRDTISASVTDFRYSPGFNTTDFKCVVIPRMLIPLNFYNVNSNTNSIRIIDNTATSLTITMVNGFYSATELATELATRLNAASADTFTVVFNSQQGTFTITDAAGTFSILWTDALTDNQAPVILGFDRTVDNTGAAAYTSGVVANVQYTRYFTLHSRFLYTEFDNDNETRHSDNRPTLIQYIPLVVGGFGTLMHFAAEFPVHFMLRRHGNLRFFDFQLRDEHNNILDNNGGAIVIELEFSTNI